MSRRVSRSSNVLRVSRFLTVFVAAAAVVVSTIAPATLATASASTSASTSLARVASDPVQTNIVKTSLAGFNPGNIMSDAVFTNDRTMTEAQIQSFLNSKVPKCVVGKDEDGLPFVCLKDLRVATQSKPADAYCSAYSGASSESSARIIYKVATACNINPQVLIVMLQKEQGLVTHVWPSNWRYNKAMGQACPDTAPCNVAFAGFFAQVYGAARQMQIYMEGKYFQWYKAGKTWDILYHPNRECGTSPVYIANKATEALYYYTPYQPNAAALRAGYGLGDGCSSYGNRNFYNYFTDWFGPTNHSLRTAIDTTWKSTGGAAGPLGSPSAGERYVAANGGGYVQEFAGGTIWLAKGATDAFALSNGPIRDSYRAAGGPAGTWGWLAGTPRCGLIDDGCLILFQNGTVGYSPSTNAALIPAPIAAEWNRVGAVSMGYPIAIARCGLADGGCLQYFQRATVGYSPATGALVMSPRISAGWNKYGAAALGYPIAPSVETAANGGGESQEFSKGTIWASSSGAFTLAPSPVRDAYLAAGGPSSAFGWPAGDVRCGLIGGGCLLAVSNGTIGFAPKSGAVLIPAVVAKEWNRVGAVKLGYPLEPASGVPDGALSQQFDSGTIFATAKRGVTIFKGPFLDAYVEYGGVSSPAGAPVTAPRCGMINDGCLMAAVNGTVGYSSSTGVMLIPHTLAAQWNRVGAAKVGYPVESAISTDSRSLAQRFSRGALFASSNDAVVIMNSPLLTAYMAATNIVKAGGVPLMQPRCGMIDGGCLMLAERGTIGFSPASGARLIPPVIAAEWNRVGAVRLGYPTSAAVVSGKITTQQFQRGAVVHDSGTGTTTIR